MAGPDVPGIRPVNPDFVDLLRVFSQIFHVSKHMTLAILANEIS